MMQALANSFHIVVKIEKALQLEKREKVNGIYIAPQYQYMLYNLQWGTIISIGERVHEDYPFIEEGDILLFHHTIEDDEWRLVDTDEELNEYRIVAGVKENFNYEIFGVVRQVANETLFIPDTQYIFVSPKMKPLKKSITSDVIAIVDPSLFEDEQYLNMKIAECELQVSNLKATVESNKDNLVLADQCVKSMYAIAQEMKGYTNRLNQKKIFSVEIIAIHDSLSKELDLSIADRIVVNRNELYPLDVQGHKLLLANKDFVMGKLVETE